MLFDTSFYTGFGRLFTNGFNAKVIEQVVKCVNVHSALNARYSHYFLFDIPLA